MSPTPPQSRRASPRPCPSPSPTARTTRKPPSSQSKVHVEVRCPFPFRISSEVRPRAPASHSCPALDLLGRERLLGGRPPLADRRDAEAERDRESDRAAGLQAGVDA